MASSIDFSKKTLALVTGASQGIGQCIAIELARLLKNDSIFILIARSEKGLNQTKAAISNLSKNITVKTYALDLAQTEQKIFLNLLQENTTAVDNAVIFHNAGSVGKLDVTTTYTNLEEWKNYYQLNLFSVSLLNSAFIEVMQAQAKKLFVINITSLCGRSPFKNLGMYGSGKAARDLFFKVLATEEPEITVLNYSPGPVDTDMVGDIISNVKNEEVKSTFVKLRDERTILQAETTVGMLLKIIGSGDYKSGDIIDYYDRT